MRTVFRLAIAALALASTASGHAQTGSTPSLPFVSPMFTDHMVIQRGMRDPVWGWANPGDKVTVTMEGRQAEAVAGPDGKWTARIGPFSAGGPYTLAIAGGSQHVTLSDVLVGDVWICSGQSNMEFGIGNADNSQQEIAAADYPNIRLFTVQKAIANQPRATAVGHWDVCTPQTVAAGGWNGFTAVGYFFGRDLYKKLHIPIGLIHTSWGGTVAEAWTSLQSLDTMADFHSAAEAVAANTGKPGDNPNVSTVLYNGMIAPIVPFGIKGAIWYQGESNAGRAFQYRTLLPTMIRDWRTHWGEGEFPFLIVQLANWQAVKPDPGDDQWAELREAQALTARSVPKCGLATAVDIGDANDIHPKNKQEVGRRLALQALDIAYGEHVEDSGPTYRGMKRDGSAIRISFDHVRAGLTSHGDAVKGFAIAGADKHWVWADAKIDGNTVIVRSSQVSDPVAVRYSWAINPIGNLYNGSGLPAIPFRTDDWPEITEKAK